MSVTSDMIHNEIIAPSCSEAEAMKKGTGVLIVTLISGVLLVRIEELQTSVSQKYDEGGD